MLRFLQYNIVIIFTKTFKNAFSDFKQLFTFFQELEANTLLFCIVLGKKDRYCIKYNEIYCK